MRPHYASIAFLSFLSACASAPERAGGGYGNFVEQQPGAHGANLANDAVVQLARSYAPANTRFELQQPTPDAFGQRLVESLRAKGYAVLEQKRPGDTRAAHPKAANTGSPPSPAEPAGLELGYIVDRAGSQSLYRLTMLVGGHSLTRAYLEQDGVLKAAGAWLREE